jgi:hypothetical protein
MQLPKAPARRVLNADMSEDFASTECVCYGRLWKKS